MAKELDMGESGGKPKKGRKKLVIIIVLVLLLLTLGGGAAVWYFMFDGSIPFLSSRKQEPSVAAETALMIPDGPAQPIGKVVPMPPFTVNLADPLGRRLIKITLSLEVASEPVIEELKAQQPRVRDAVIMLLSSKTYADIATQDSKLVLKSELTSRLNQILGGQKIVQVFITDLIIN
jgi:Flagellar basal body-associated protein